MGKIYILTNASMPGLVKIGHTEREAEERAVELSSSTGVPTNFEIFRSYEVENSAIFERQIHTKLDSFRVSGNREFFRMDAEDASRIVEEELPTREVSRGGELDLNEHYEREDELLRQATDLTKDVPEIWPGMISGALKISHEKACELLDTLKARALVDNDGRCQLYLNAVRQNAEAAKQKQRFDEAKRRSQRWVEENKPSEPFTAKEALAYLIAIIGVGVAAEAYNFEADKVIIVGSMITAFGVMLIFKFRKGR